MSDDMRISGPTRDALMNLLLDSIEADLAALRRIVARPTNGPEVAPTVAEPEAPEPDASCTHPKERRRQLSSMGDAIVEMCMACGEQLTSDG